MPTKVFIGNISASTRDAELKLLFGKFGTVTECAIVKNYGFVHMELEDEAKAAISALDNHSLNGLKMHVELSHGKRREGGSGFRGGGRGGYQGSNHHGGYGSGASSAYSGGAGSGYGSGYANGAEYGSYGADSLYGRDNRDLYRSAYARYDPYGRPPPREYARPAPAPQDPYADQYSQDTPARPPPDYYRRPTTTEAYYGRYDPNAQRYSGMTSSQRSRPY